MNTNFASKKFVMNNGRQPSSTIEVLEKLASTIEVLAKWLLLAKLVASLRQALSLKTGANVLAKRTIASTLLPFYEHNGASKSPLFFYFTKKIFISVFS